MRYIRLCALVLLGMGTTVAVAQTAPTQNQRVLIRRSERFEILRRDTVFSSWPVWGGRALLGFDGNHSSTPVIWALDRDGGKEEIQFSIQEAALINIWSLAGSPDGMIIVAGSAIGNDSQSSGYLAMIAPDRNRRIVVRTWPYIPNAIAVAPNGVIWTVGWDQRDGKRIFNVLKRFDRFGTLLSSSQMNVKGALGGDATFGSKLCASEDRVGWLTAASEYLEFSLDGKQIGRFDGPPWNPTTQVGTGAAVFMTVAMNANNETIVGGTGPLASIWILDREARSWKALGIEGDEPRKSAILYGFDGDELIVGTRTPDKRDVIGRFSFSASN